MTNEKRLLQATQNINAWAAVALKCYQRNPKKWWIELVKDLAKESDRVLKACEKQETGHE